MIDIARVNHKAASSQLYRLTVNDPLCGYNSGMAKSFDDLVETDNQERLGNARRHAQELLCNQPSNQNRDRDD